MAKEISAYFANEDDAEDAAIKLKTVHATNITFDHFDPEQLSMPEIMPYYTIGSRSGITLEVATNPMPSTPLGPFATGFTRDVDEGGFPGNRWDHPQKNVMLTFTIDESHIDEAMNIIRMKRGDVQ